MREVGSLPFISEDQVGIPTSRKLDVGNDLIKGRTTDK